MGISVILHQTAGRGDPAGVPAHHLDDEHSWSKSWPWSYIEEASQGGYRDVLGHRAEAGAAVGDGQVVVHGLGHVDGLDGIARRLGQLGNLVAGVG